MPAPDMSTDKISIKLVYLLHQLRKQILQMCAGIIYQQV